MVKLAKALEKRVANSNSPIPCLAAPHCQDIPDKECRYCILYDGDTEFNADPIKWLLDKKYITKGQALQLTLESN